MHVIYNTVSALEPVSGLNIIKKIEEDYRANLRGVIYVYLNSMVDDGYLFAEEQPESQYKEPNFKRLYYTTNKIKRPSYSENKTQKTFWGGLTPSTS